MNIPVDGDDISSGQNIHNGSQAIEAIILSKADLITHLLI
jgi:hypothetical protein